MRKALCILLSFVLIIQGAPLGGAYATEPLETQAVVEHDEAIEVQGTSGDDYEVVNADVNHEEKKRTTAGDKTAYESGTLSKELAGADGHAYVVKVDYDEAACIPANAELLVAEVGESDLEDVRTRAALLLNLQDDERMLWDGYIDVSILADGHVVEPQSEMRVTVETDAIKPSQSASAEVVVLRGEDEPGAEESEIAWQVEEAAPEGELVVDDALTEPQTCGEHIVPTNLTQQKSKKTELSFETDRLGTIGLACVTTRLTAWQEPGLDMWLLGPRHGLTANVGDAEVPDLEDGIDALTCFLVSAEPNLACGTTLWLEAEPTELDGMFEQDATTAEDDASAIEPVSEVEDESSISSDVYGGTFAYAVRDGKLSRELFGPEGTTEPVAFRADKDSVLLAWDSGYRKATIAMRGVTVKGMLPEGTTGTACNVAEDLNDPYAFVGEIDAQDEIDAGTMELQTVAAYDITLTTDGSEYEPDDEHPLTVTIADEGIQKDKDLQLWHILDDGTTEAVENFEVTEGAIVFTATGFSTYAVTELRATTTATTTGSTSFIIKCVAKGYTRSSTVTFVDTEKNPIASTESGIRTLTFTGTGDVANDTNSVDMHSYIDCLDPSIADEYDFSRVYMVLDKTYDEQKDFRYICVADDTVIGENRNPPYYRAYMYMDSIDQCREGEEYNGTWYLLSYSGPIDPIYIEYYHVALASFYSVDTRGDPVAGAEFTLYSDPNCYTPFEYKNQVVKATSTKRGLVSFGKIPRGTYYMKETVIPEGYKKSTKVRTIMVDGEHSLPDVVHPDDDGSVIISNAQDITFYKEWKDTDVDYDDYNVTVTVSTNDETVAELELNDSNNWTQTLTGLDPNKSYEISESGVLNDEGKDVLKEWAPTIESKVTDEWVEYQTVDEFIKGKDYVLVANGKALTAVATNNTLTPQVVTVSNGKITSGVTNYMLWDVEDLTKDGVITLRNMATEKHLDQDADKNIKWYQNANEPKFVRHLNDDGTIYIYYRENLNRATSTWLYMVNRVDRSMRFSDAAPFALYRKVDVKTYDVTITNKPTTYPVKMRNVHYPSDEAFPNTEFALYTEASYKSSNPTPLMTSLVAGEDGYLLDGTSSTIQLSAGTYYLVRTSDADGYVPIEPLRFTITYKGAIVVEVRDRAISDYEYSSTVEVSGHTYPLLKIPNYKPANLDVHFEVEGDYADLTREFDFRLTLAEGTVELKGYVNGVAKTFYSDETNEFKLAHGQSFVLRDVPEGAGFTLTQTSSAVAASAESASGQYVPSASITSPEGTQSTVTIDVADGDARAITFSGILGTTDDPAQVTIVNSLGSDDVPATGIDENATLWRSIVMACSCVLFAFWLRSRRLRLGRRT